MNAPSVAWPGVVAVAGVLGLYSATADAVSVVGTIGTAANYSVIHDGSNPGGTGSVDDWFWFDDQQQIDLDYSGGVLSLDGAQAFAVSTRNGTTGSVLFTDMLLDLNGASGFAGGQLSYILNGQTSGTFLFEERRYGNSPFNSSSLVDGLLSVYVWGGDDANGLGIDLGISAPVPVPGTLLLIGIGAFGLVAGRRRIAPA